MDPFLQSLLAQSLRKQAPGSGVLANPNTGPYVQGPELDVPVEEDGLEPMPDDWAGKKPFPADAPIDPNLLELQYLAQQSPEAAMQQFTPYEDQQSILDKQLMLAQQLRQPKSSGHTSAVGALLGGLGDTIDSGVGAYKQRQSLGALQDLAGQKQRNAANRTRDYAKWATGFRF